jgi:hypothetical protein
VKFFIPKFMKLRYYLGNWESSELLQLQNLNTMELQKNVVKTQVNHLDVKKKMKKEEEIWELKIKNKYQE